MSLDALPGVRFERLPVGELTLHCALAGDPDAPLVVLLHGFPELWFGWRRQICALADAGYFVVAPDQRGYNLSDRPSHAREYASEHLVSDVVGLARALGRERLFLAGHDWGGAVAFYVAQRHPELVEKLCVLNCPHPRVLLRALLRRPEQLKKSWYILFFQLPFVAERVFATGDFATFARWLSRAARAGAFGEEELEVYRAAWRREGAMKAMLDYYRAAARYDEKATADAGLIEPETLLIWGRKDVALGPWLVQPTLERCAQARVEWVDQAGHFVQLEEPARVTELLLEHFSS